MWEETNSEKGKSDRTMTREEAIHFAVCLKNNWTIDFNDMEEFCDMAIEALQREEAEEKGYCHRIKPKEYLSADAEPTVIRSKTLMPTKDFKEWAKRIREENPNAVIIPCDAEVVSADSVVRCKDCRHRCKEPIYSKADVHWVIYQIGDCPIICKTVGDDDYCSFGERREP